MKEDQKAKKYPTNYYGPHAMVSFHSKFSLSSILQ